MTYFDLNGEVKAKKSKITFSVDLKTHKKDGIEIGFTRGAISSQQYLRKFGSKRIRPKNHKSIIFSTDSFEEQYRCLGAHGRKLVFDFFKEFENNPKQTMDVMAYDLDEPDIIANIAKGGERCCMFLDNSTHHHGHGAREDKAEKILERADVKIRRGKFSRYAHNKVFILKKDELPIKVLTGSANFLIRGLYAQSNNILVFDDPVIVELYEQVFEESYFNEKKFKKTEISEYWWHLKQSKDLILHLALHHTPNLHFLFPIQMIS